MRISMTASGVLAATILGLTGCSTSSRRVETLEGELRTARRHLEESRAAVRRLDDRAGKATELAARIAELEKLLEMHVSMNDELRVRTVELEKLWSDSRSHSLALSRQIYLLRREKDRFKRERDDLFARQHSDSDAGEASDLGLAEVDVRIAELKGVCLYFPADSYAATQAKSELNRLEAHRLALLNPRDEDQAILSE